jgi:hypothetical protein
MLRLNHYENHKKVKNRKTHLFFTIGTMLSPACFCTRIPLKATFGGVAYRSKKLKEKFATEMGREKK